MRKKAREGQYPFHFVRQEDSWFVRGVGLKNRYQRKIHHEKFGHYHRYVGVKRRPTYEYNPIKFFWFIFDLWQSLLINWFFKGVSFINFSLFFNLLKYDFYFVSMEFIIILLLSFFEKNSFFVMSYSFIKFLSFFISFIFYLIQFFCELSFINFFFVVIQPIMNFPFFFFLLFLSFFLFCFFRLFFLFFFQ